MNRLMGLLEPFKDNIRAHPYIFGVTAVLSLMIWVLRKVHYRFVVFPGKDQMSQICRVGRIAATASTTGIPTIGGWTAKILK